MYYYYIIERLASNGKWYRQNTYDHKITAMEMAQHFHEKDGEKYRVVEVQVRDIIITYENKPKKGVNYDE